MKRKIGKLNTIKMKHCSVKERRQATDCEKIFAENTSDKALVPKICKELLKLNSKRTNIPTKK